ncbi:serine/arginine repetitive matrix protein 1-like [Schistocerca americana]|uniref:serine/arginine repetitive matrix protein 1-like n=1 Tax=Schistocerca americana TaxID=7009 RepID=UPI001F4FB6C1|nr:serine/arginine repetitive matrix protein 1-like [Schistocerca americana]
MVVTPTFPVTALTLTRTRVLSAPRLEARSSSEPQLSRLPPGLTVDELPRYRRRRPPQHLCPQDNLRPARDASFKAVKSEYRRRFLSYPLQREEHARHARRPRDLLRLEGEADFSAEYRDRFVAFPRQRPRRCRPPACSQLAPPADAPMEVGHPAARRTASRHAAAPHLATGGRFCTRRCCRVASTEQASQYVCHGSPARAPLLRRRTSLRTEGDLLVRESELRARFKRLQGAQRAELARRPTTLRMEGEMETRTEHLERFCEPGSGARRAELSKRRTQLQLEGEHARDTESRASFAPPSAQLSSEYRALFADFPQRDPPVRRRPPQGNLAPGPGEMEKVTEKRAHFVDWTGVAERPRPHRRSSSLKLEMEMAGGSGGGAVLPEYRERFVEFPAVARPPAATRALAQSLRLEGDLLTETEKSSQFVDHYSPVARRRQRPPSGGDGEGSGTGTGTLPPLATAAQRPAAGKRTEDQATRDQQKAPATPRVGSPSPSAGSGRRRPTSASPHRQQTEQQTEQQQQTKVARPADTQLEDAEESAANHQSPPPPQPQQLLAVPVSEEKPAQPTPGAAAQTASLPPLPPPAPAPAPESKSSSGCIGGTTDRRLTKLRPEPEAAERRRLRPAAPGEVYRAFHVLEKPEKTVTFEMDVRPPTRGRSVSRSGRGSRCSDERGSCSLDRALSPGYRMQVLNVDDNGNSAPQRQPDVAPTDTEGTAAAPRPTSPTARRASSPLPLPRRRGSHIRRDNARHAFIVLDNDNGNNDNGNNSNLNNNNNTTRSGMLDVPRGRGGWVPSWYNAPTSI